MKLGVFGRVGVFDAESSNLVGATDDRAVAQEVCDAHPGELYAVETNAHGDRVAWSYPEDV